MSEIKYIDIAEFRRLGFLQEVNRQFFHPLGLALAVSTDEDGSAVLAGVWDYRDDPEGVYFDADLDEEFRAKAAHVAAERAKHEQARVAFLGAVVQPVGQPREDPNGE